MNLSISGWVPEAFPPVTLVRAVLVIGLVAGAWGQATAPATNPPAAMPGEQKAADADVRSDYVLGPEDMILVQLQDVQFMGDTPVRIEASGYVRLPMVGRVKAGGMTPMQFEEVLAQALKKFVRDPQPSVRVTEFRSQPVTVIGAVQNPGIHQLRGRKRLLEMISMAGGLRGDAGRMVTVTRNAAKGKVPLAQARADENGQFSIATIDLRGVMEARHPEENIVIEPDDVIAVEKAPVVYVIGAVKKSGGFVLNAQERVSVLQALAMAEGLDRVAAPERAKLVRRSTSSAERQETAVNLRRLLDGKTEDVDMLPDDILFVPTSGARSAGYRALEAAIQVGTGVAIFRR